jgi:hypothetical protein
MKRGYMLFQLLTTLLLSGLIVAACSSNIVTPPISTQTPQSTATTVPSVVSTVVETGTTIPPTVIARTSEGYPIQVYFSKYAASLTNVEAVFPVQRTSPTIMVGAFAIQLLIAGPTPKEWDAGYFSELNSSLTGPSSCTGSRPVGGPDFTLNINVKGAQPQPGTATLRFCRIVTTAGIGTDARIQSEITATLKQFSSIKKVVILTKDGHCFGDGSGQDRCLI